MGTGLRGFEHPQLYRRGKQPTPSTIYVFIREQSLLHSIDERVALTSHIFHGNAADDVHARLHRRGNTLLHGGGIVMAFLNIARGPAVRDDVALEMPCITQVFLEQ